MSLYSQIIGRQYSSHDRFTGSLWPVLTCLQSHYSDEVVLYGGMTAAPVPVFTCKFTKDGLHGHLLATGDEEGSVRLMDTRRPASQSLIKEIEAHRNAVFDVSWYPGGTKLLTGSGDATVRLWDVVGGVMLDEFKAHSASVKTVDVKTDEPGVFVSGGRDGSIQVWDTRCARRGPRHKPVNSIFSAHKKVEAVATTTKKRQRGRRSAAGSTNKGGDVKHSVTAVLFHGDHGIASCGTADGLVKLWDLRRTYTNSRLEPPPAWHMFEPLTEAGRQYSFTSLVSGPHQSTLFASCTDDLCYMYNSAGLNKSPVRVFSGHKNSSFYVKSCVSPDGQYLLSGSSCGNAFLWQVDYPEAPPLMLSGHTKEVTAVAWCPTDLSKIATCSDDNDLRLWRVGRGQRSPGEVTGTCQSYVGEGHLKGLEFLRRRTKDPSSQHHHTRPPLHPIQPRPTKEHTTPLPAQPTTASLNLHHSDGSQHQRHTIDKDSSLLSPSLPQQSVHVDSWVDTSISSCPEAGVTPSSSTSLHRLCFDQRRQKSTSEGSASGLAGHRPCLSKQTIDSFDTKGSIERSLQPRLTSCECTETSLVHESRTSVAETTGEERADILVEGGDGRLTEVTPDRKLVPDSLSGSVAKRRLELEDKRQAKRRRTGFTSSGRKAGVNCNGNVVHKQSGSAQMTMQSYFRPA